MERILITGANRGLGLELVRQYLAETDAILVASCRQPNQAQALKELAAAHPGRLHVATLDLDQPDSFGAVAEQIAGMLPALDVLLHNAGTNPVTASTRKLGELQAEAVTAVIAANAVGPLLLTQALLPLLQKGQNRRVVMVSSQTGSMDWVSSGGGYAYRMSKSAMNMASRTLAMELQPQDISVMTLHPGWVQTDMGGPNASITAQESARGVRDLVASLDMSRTGSFYNWNGTVHAW